LYQLIQEKKNTIELLKHLNEDNMRSLKKIIRRIRKKTCDEAELIPEIILSGFGSILVQIIDLNFLQKYGETKIAETVVEEAL